MGRHLSELAVSGLADLRLCGSLATVASMTTPTKERDKGCTVEAQGYKVQEQDGVRHTETRKKKNEISTRRGSCVCVLTGSLRLG